MSRKIHKVKLSMPAGKKHSSGRYTVSLDEQLLLHVIAVSDVGSVRTQNATHYYAAENVFGIYDEEMTPTVSSLLTTVYTEGNITLFHKGDSRAYAYRPQLPHGTTPGSRLEQLTADHSEDWTSLGIWEAYQRGESMPKENARQTPVRHISTSAFTRGENTSVPFFSIKYSPGDVYLLCSYGLWHELPDAAIEDIFARNYTPSGDCIPKIAKELLENAKAAGGHGNIVFTLGMITEADRIPKEKPIKPIYQRTYRQIYHQIAHHLYHQIAPHLSFPAVRKRAAALWKPVKGIAAYTLITLGTASSIFALNAITYAGVFEAGLRTIPSLVGHGEVGKYWESIHTYQDLLARINNAPLPERQNTEQVFPDPRIIREYRITDSNAIRYSVANGEKPLMEDKPTKQYLPLSQMETIAPAVVQREDKEFYAHHGINWKGAARAVLYLGKRGGGSSITIQVAKQLMLNGQPEQRTTFQRTLLQLEEAVLATEIEKECTKEEILEFYLNNIYFAPGVFGVQPAAQFYFEKDARTLTREESLFLASLISSPGNIIHEDRQKQEAWMRKRLATYNAFLAEEVDTKTRNNYVHSIERILTEGITTGRFDKRAYSRTLYHENFPSAMSLLFHDLQHKYGVNVQQMRADQERLYAVDIQTTIDPQLTKDINRALKIHLGKWAQHYAFVLVNETGEIKTIIGDNNYNDFTAFNYATHGQRPLASTIKPFVYAFGIEHGVFSLDSVFSDERRGTCNKIKDYCITNHDDTYGRLFSIPEALRNSNNMMAVRAYQEILRESSYDTFAQYLEELGINLSSKNKDTVRVALGIDAVSPLRLALAYASFLDGYAHDYSLVDKVILGNQTVQERRDQTRHQIFSPTTAQNMQSILNFIALGKIEHPVYFAGIKTGTYEDDQHVSRDLWTAGILQNKFTPGGYAFALWVDNSDGALGKQTNAAALSSTVQQIILSIP